MHLDQLLTSFDSVELYKYSLGLQIFEPQNRSTKELITVSTSEHELVQILSQALDGEVAVTFAEVRFERLVLQEYISHSRYNYQQYLHCQCVEDRGISVDARQQSCTRRTLTTYEEGIELLQFILNG